MKFSSIRYCSTDLRIPESEAFEILRVASLGCRLEQPDKRTAIVNGNYFLSLTNIYTCIKLISVNQIAFVQNNMECEIIVSLFSSLA